MNRLALGTVQLGLPYGIANQAGQVSRSEAGLMLAYAESCGISIIDTAIAYGDSETCLGAIGVKGFKVVTKLPSAPNDIDIANVRNWVHNQVTASLRRLDVTKLYGLLLHKPGQLLGRFGAPLAGALLELKAQGLIDKLGVSIYAPEELEAIDHIFQIELVQAPFNLLDRRLLTSGWLGHLKERDIEVHTRSAFLQGLLLMPMASIPSGFEQWAELLQTWHQWLAKNDISALQACLSFSLSHPEINRVVVGADSVVHLKQIIAAVSRDIELELPNLNCEDLNLIDPSYWEK
jgi:aryl-alcohol dehydrogenase-like predicted oxidoreductase